MLIVLLRANLKHCISGGGVGFPLKRPVFEFFRGDRQVFSNILQSSKPKKKPGLRSKHSIESLELVGS